MCQPVDGDNNSVVTVQKDETAVLMCSGVCAGVFLESDRVWLRGVRASGCRIASNVVCLPAN